ncbi:MAG: mechanosensitive ion channel family protein [Lachnospiraceae bacterium]|nr:mechanosensitive ion channel family protein [Lachnospiraceae bacterium]
MTIILAELPGTEEISSDISESLSAIFKANIKSSTIDFLIKLLFAAIVFVIGVYVIRFVRKVIVKYLNKTSVPIDNISFIDSMVKIILYFVLILFIAGNFGIQATSILALVGSAGLTIGLAFQGALSNFAGGVLILMTKPFKLGDYIVISPSYEGTVTDIDIVHTKLRTLDNRIIVIPNGTLANTTLINSTAEEKRKIELSLPVAYSSDIDKVRAVILDVVKKEENIEDDGEAVVFVESFGDSAINVGLRVYVHTVNYLPTKWRLSEDIKKAFDRNGIEIPFDQLDVHIKQDT